MTLRDDEELTEFLGEMCALGLVRIRDEFDESATSAAAESDTSATESGEGATSATGTPAKLARSIWELESGGLYMPFYSGV